jgi:hypothetical protein
MDLTEPKPKKKGRPKKTKEQIIEEIKNAKVTVKPKEEPKTEEPKVEQPVNLPNIEHESISITASDNAGLEPCYDPWETIIDEKSDRKKYYHRAINIKPSILSKRKYQGYEIVPGQNGPIGDLILARMPWNERNKRIRQKEGKIQRRS